MLFMHLRSDRSVFSHSCYSSFPSIQTASHGTGRVGESKNIRIVYLIIACPRKVKHGPDMMVLIERAFISHSVYTPYRQQHGNPSADGERAAFEKLDLTR
jgi:hypothetical protein